MTKQPSCKGPNRMHRRTRLPSTTWIHSLSTKARARPSLAKLTPLCYRNSFNSKIMSLRATESAMPLHLCMGLAKVVTCPAMRTPISCIVSKLQQSACVVSRTSLCYLRNNQLVPRKAMSNHNLKWTRTIDSSVCRCKAQLLRTRIQTISRMTARCS